MRKKLAEQHRKAAYEALHGQPPPPASSQPPTSNHSRVDRNVIRDKMEFNEYKCHSCFYFVVVRGGRISSANWIVTLSENGRSVTKNKLSQYPLISQ